jgi:hypothetical protein
MTKSTGRGRGRLPGTKNKSTIERETRARLELEAREAEMHEGMEDIRSARRAGNKLAREVLEDLMRLGMGLTATYQQLAGLTPEQISTTRGVASNSEMEKRFWYAAEFTKGCAVDLANYQSPKLKAQVPMGPLPDSNPQAPLMLPAPAPGSTNVQYFLEHTYRRMLKTVNG